MENPLLFRNRYRIPSIRMQGWDYREPGWYFVTICTKGKECWFGEVKDQTMMLSDIGQVVHRCWLQIPQHFRHVTLDDWVVMPNHVHGIVVIGEREKCRPVETCDSHVSTNAYIRRPTPGSLGSIIGQYKSTCTKLVHRMGNTDFAWQPRFHERLIRDPDETIRIRQYIRTNPLMWEQDDLHRQ